METMSYFFAFFILVACFGIFGVILYFDHKEKMAKEKKAIGQDWLSRDYQNVPGIERCPRCGAMAHLTTTVNIPPIETESRKLKFNKYDMRIFYSIRCNNCSMGTGNVEELAVVMNDWNSQAVVRR